MLLLPSHSLRCTNCLSLFVSEKDCLGNQILPVTRFRQENVEPLLMGPVYQPLSNLMFISLPTFGEAAAGSQLVCVFFLFFSFSYSFVSLFSFVFSYFL